jgi:hypothetical protein
MNDRDRMLFMRYALPCAGTLVKRCSITQEKWDELIETVRGGEAPDGAEKIFKVAFAACSLIARDAGKAEIDEEVIRQYYLFEHDRMIDKRYEEMGDFDTGACRIRSGIVRAVGDGHAVVENSTGTSSYRTDYCSVAVGDVVTTHWNFVVEKINAAVAKEMQMQKITARVV